MKSPLIVVSVGTDNHHHRRLMDWTGRWAHDHADADVVVQQGASEAPLGVRAIGLVSHEELTRLYRNATAVVTHGGPGTIRDAQTCGFTPIVVPRMAEHGEHVDDHQVLFTRHLAELGEIHIAANEIEYRALLDAAVADPTSVRATGPHTDPAPATRALANRVEQVLAAPFGPRIYRSRLPVMFGRPITATRAALAADPTSRPAAAADPVEFPAARPAQPAQPAER